MPSPAREDSQSPQNAKSPYRYPESVSSNSTTVQASRNCDANNSATRLLSVFCLIRTGLDNTSRYGHAPFSELNPQTSRSLDRPRLAMLP